MSENSAASYIVGEGLIAGFFFGAYLKTGISADPESVMQSTIASFYNAIQPYLPPQNNMLLTFQIVSISITILGILSFIATIKLVGNLIEGLILFGIGFFPMLTLILIFG
jgi:hypothetical protein